MPTPHPTAPADEERAGSLLGRDPLTVATWAFAALSALVLALGLLTAIALPYGEWDAMAFGTWSREIALHWPRLHFSDASQADYERPLFYVLQGTVWAAVGFHQALGRVLSFLFSCLLVAAVAWTAARAAGRRFAAALAVLLALLVTPFERYAAAGLSDIPVAALVALTGALLLAPRLGRARLPLVALAAALSMLAKPSALFSLAGLAVAVLLGSRAGLRRRSGAFVAVAAGAGAGLLWDVSQARYLHIPLQRFLAAGTDDAFYSQLARAARRSTLLDGSWLGADLRLLLAFAVLYALARLALDHRPAVAAALPAAAVWSWLGPHLAGAHGIRAGILGTGGPLEQASVLLLAASLLLALLAPPQAIPSRLQLARALVWATPPFVLWAWRVVYDVRLLSPAWPPLLVLMTGALLPAFAGARQRRAWLVLPPAAAAIALGALSVNEINGLGSHGWSSLRGGLGDPAAMRSIALGGDFSAEMNALAPQVRPRDRILTYDARLRFFYLTQTDLAAPESCAQARGHRIFVLLESDEMRTIYGGRAAAPFWEACRDPRLTMVVERPGAFALFVNGAPTPSVGGCGAPPPTPGLAIQFGPDFRTQAAADALLARATGAGFVEAKVEQLGCASYRVVETGVPSDSVGRGILAEAKAAHLPARLVDQ